jgi:hypothetical protein
MDVGKVKRPDILGAQPGLGADDMERISHQGGKAQARGNPSAS